MKVLALGLFFSSAALAQTTDCHQWSSTDITCRTTPDTQSPRYNAADHIEHRDFVSSFLNAKRAAEAAALQRELAESQMALATAQRQLLEEQARAQRLQNDRLTGQVQSAPTDQVSYKHWLAAATPRIGLFADFDSTVFVEDLPLTIPMVEWMSHSKYAADIAYYLGKHKVLADQISRQSAAGMANSLADIESGIASSVSK